METEPEIHIPPRMNYGMDADSLKFRLNPEPILFEIEKKLKGGFLEYGKDEKGEVKSKWVTTGSQLMNDKGIQRIMNRASSVINHATVLGYFKDFNEYFKFMYIWRGAFRREIFMNRKEYGIERVPDIDHIISVVSDFAELFLTRLIGREESKALQRMVNVVETHTVGEAKKFGFGFGGGK